MPRWLTAASLQKIPIRRHIRDVLADRNDNAWRSFVPRLLRRGTKRRILHGRIAWHRGTRTPDAHEAPETMDIELQNPSQEEEAKVVVDTSAQVEGNAREDNQSNLDEERAMSTYIQTHYSYEEFMLDLVRFEQLQFNDPSNPEVNVARRLVRHRLMNDLDNEDPDVLILPPEQFHDEPVVLDEETLENSLSSDIRRIRQNGLEE